MTSDAGLIRFPWWRRRGPSPDAVKALAQAREDARRTARQAGHVEALARKIDAHQAQNHLAATFRAALELRKEP